MIRITTLDYAILGLLLSGPKTAYAIRMIFKSTAMGNYSSSPGSIYPSTNKLKKLKLVVHEGGNKGNLKITDEGTAQIKEWLTQPITAEMVEKESQVLTLKFAFMDHLVTKEEKVAFLESFLERSKAYLKSLEAFHVHGGAGLPLHAGLSFQLGIAVVKTQITWLTSTLQIINKT